MNRKISPRLFKACRLTTGICLGSGLNLIAAEKSAPALSDSRPALSGSPALQGKLAQADWSVYLGDKGRRQSSPLAQIDKRNVAQLQVAWTYDTGEKGEYQSNNLVIAGVLYTASASRRVIALNAATGQELWTWDPTTERAGAGARRQRGVAYWENETGGERRIFTVVGNYLYALSPETGLPIRSFGDNGSLHLGIGMDLEETPSVSLNTPGVVYQDLLIIGANTDAPGAIRALDVRTGHRRWIFHLIPRPGEFGYDTWPVDAYKTIGGASAWSGQSLDEARGIVYISSETAGPDFYGGARHGMNLFANSVVALDAGTGRRLWHFQIVHHDLLDKDLPAPPVLITVTHRGKQIDAVAQGTKHGLLFVFDRVTGEPLWPIEERPVPQTDLAGEQTWPTQPFPVKPAPLMRQSYTEADISNVSPEAQLMSLDRIKVSPNFGPFPAPSLRETIMFPGFDGGFEWGGAAANSNGILYVNINEMPWILRMIDPRRPDGTRVSEGERQYMIHCAACHGIDRMGDIRGGFPSLVEIEKRRTPEQVRQLVTQGGGRMPAFDRLPERQLSAVLNLIQGVEPPPRASRPPGVGEAGGGGASPESEGPRYAFGGFRRWLDKEGYPAIKPPWGTLNAVDLNTGEIKWKVPLGEYPELTARGVLPTGTENYGGPVVTAGGLIFIGATADEKFRAFDQDTGEMLWQATLPFGGNATPSVYMVDGRQYVVISAGGGKSGRPAGGSLVAFALPSIPSGAGDVRGAPAAAPKEIR